MNAIQIETQDRHYYFLSGDNSFKSHLLSCEFPVRKSMEEEILNKELKRIENQLSKDQTDRLQSEGLLESRSFSFGGRHIVAVMKDQYTISYKMENMVNSYFKRCLNNLLESDVHMVNENEIILKLKA